MIEVVGHGKVRAVLYQDRPLATHLWGPDSVGKWTTAEWFREVLECLPIDVLRARFLTAERARDVVQFLSVAPQGTSKLAIVGTDDTSEEILEMLLKTVEEIREPHHVVFVGQERLPATLRSRLRAFPMAYLSQSQIEEILLLKGFGKPKAERLSKLAGGQVLTALTYHETQEKKIVVLAAVRSIVEHDPKTLAQLASRWSEDHTSLLTTLCRETITGYWSAWDEIDSEGLPKLTAMKILRALRQDIRPRLIVQSSLLGVLRGEQ